MANRAKRDLCTGPLLSGMLLYALPIMATGILQVLYNTADTFVVALSAAGDSAVAAISSTTPTIALLVNLFNGICSGVLTVVARHIGARNEHDAHKSVHTAMSVALIGGLALMIVGVLVARPFLQLIGTGDEDANVLKLATQYMQIYFLGMPGLLVFNFGAAILRAAGDSKRPLMFLTTSGMVNVLLNLLFVLGFGMDVAGVGIATITSEYLSAVLVVVALLREAGVIRLIPSQLRIDRRQLAEILRLGIPSGIQSALFSFSNVLIQSAINSFGAVHMAASGAAAQVESLTYTAMDAFSVTAMAFTSQNFGAKQSQRIRRVNRYAHLLNAVVGIGLGALVLLFEHPLLSLFLDSEIAIEAAKVRLRIITSMAFICGSMNIQSSHLRGLGYSIGPMIITLVGACGLRILWVLFALPLFTDATLRWQMLFLCWPMTWVITLIGQLVYSHFADRRVYRTLTTSTAESPKTEDTPATV